MLHRSGTQLDLLLNVIHDAVEGVLVPVGLLLALNLMSLLKEGIHVSESTDSSVQSEAAPE